jgi:hypothetical protein
MPLGGIHIHAITSYHIIYLISIRIDHTITVKQEPLCPERLWAHPPSCTMGTGGPFPGG